MRFDIITIFPEFFTGPLGYGIVRRAREAQLIDVRVCDLRESTHDRHRTVDDRPFGGGEGMVMKPEPVFEAVESLFEAPSAATPPANTAIVLLSAAGKMFRQQAARRFATLERVVLICGRYEGVDERVAEHLATDEISIGDFVLSGGELPAAMILDAVTRLIPGALGNEDSIVNESFSEPTRGTARAKALCRHSHLILRLPRVPNHEPQITASSIIRITLARRRFVAGMCPKFCLAETTKKSASGAENVPWRKPGAIVPTCSTAQGLAPRIAACWTRLRVAPRHVEVKPVVTSRTIPAPCECTLLWQKPG